MALEEFYEDCDREFLEVFDIVSDEVTQKLDIFFKKLNQFAITGDASLIRVDILPSNPATHSAKVLLDSKIIEKRTALANITESVNNNNVTVKQEKLSPPSQNTVSNQDNSKMPAPTIFPIKKEICHAVKRSTRTIKKPKRYTDETFLINSSDVIIQNETIPLVDITEDHVPTRNTITKSATKYSTGKGELVINSDTMEGKKKLKKHENYEDKYSTLGIKVDEANATYVLVPEVDAPTANLTLAENSKIGKNSNLKSKNQRTLQKKLCISEMNEKKKTESEIKKALQRKVRDAKAISDKAIELEKEMLQMEKKKALLQAKSEETRRRRELRQLKAQQLRQNFKEENKIEMEKSKKPKYAPAPISKLRKQLEGQMQKMDDKVKKPTNDVSNVVGGVQQNMFEINKKEAHPSQWNSGKLPTYMTIKMPLLPTNDCYDSDESVSSLSKARIPEWSKGVSLRKKQLIMEAIGHVLMNTLFCCSAQTPDLEEIFECINPRKLIRTSSAVWRTPPRYTILSSTNNFNYIDKRDKTCS